MITIRYSKQFVKSYQKLTKKDQRLKKLISKKIKLFIKNPQDKSLRTHKLSGKLKGVYSFWILPDLRILFQWQEKQIVLLVAIGSHDRVY